MANYEATKYDYSGANLTGIEGVNTGLILPWGDSSIPSGFLECDGSAVSRSTYANLFAVIGTTHGSGDGSTTFNLPDLQGKCCQNSSPTKSFATSGGSSTVTITGNIGGSASPHTLSTPEISSHTHPRSIGGSVPAGANNPPIPRTNPQEVSGSEGGGGAHTHPVSATFTGDAKSVLQPYITLIYIIKT